MTSSLRRYEYSQIVKLDDTNYSRWKLQISLLLKATDLWDIVRGATARPEDNTDNGQTNWDKKDVEAQSLIVPTLGASQTTHIYNCKTSKEMFDRLKDVNSDSSSLNKQHTLAKFLNYKVGINQSPLEAYMEVEELGRSLNEMGVVMDPTTIVTKIVSSLPDEHYLAFKKAWDSVPENTQSMPMLLARLRKEELERKQSKPDFAEKTGTVKAFSSDHFKGPKQNGKKTNIEDLKKRTKCHKCGKTGHWKKECRSKAPEISPRQQGKAFMGRVKTEGSLLQNEDWISDSGASHHICGNKDWFAEYKEFEVSKPVTLTNKEFIQAQGIGTVILEAYMNKQWSVCSLGNVLYIPGASNLFSEGVIAKKGYKIVRDDKETHFYEDGNYPGPAAYMKDNVYIMKFRPLKMNAHATNAMLWHHRLAHINSQYVQNSIVKNAIKGLELSEVKEKVMCDSCEVGKQSRKPFPNVDPKRSTKPGEMAHADLSGKMPVNSVGGAKYFLLIKDDATGFRTVYFLKQKNEAFECIEEYMKFMERQTGNQMKVFRSDNGGEFINSNVSKLFAKNGILHETSSPYCPESNGKIEREMRTVKDSARTMMCAAESPEYLWAEAVATTVYVHNRILDKQSPDCTSYERIFGRKPSLKHLRMFGSKAFVHVPSQTRSVWEPKGEELILVGYSSCSAKYRLYDKSSGGIIEARNVSFREIIPENTVEVKINPNIISDTEDDKREQTDKEESEVEDEIKESDTSSKDSSDDEEWIPSPSTNSDKTSTNENVKVLIQTPGGNYEAEVQPGKSTDIVLPNQSPSRGRGLSSWGLRDRNSIQKPERYQAHASLAVAEEPTTYKEAISSPDKEKWTEAMDLEIQSHDNNNTWTLVDKPPKIKLLDCKWVFKIKRNSDGSISVYKARLVTRGYRQEHGVDYFETFSSVCRYESIRLLLCIAAARKMQIRQFDVKTAFLYGTLDETIYMSQPEGFEKGGQNKVCKLNKSLYGLKQAPRCWNLTFTNFLKKFKFNASACDPCVFIGEMDGKIVYLSLYVDDGLIISEDETVIAEVLHTIQKDFEIKSSYVSTYVGIEISRNTETGHIYISQGFYIQTLLNRFHMLDCKPTNVPMQPNTDLLKVEGVDPNLPYPQLIGALLFLSKCSRPDIAFAVSRLSQFIHAYDSTHWKAAKQILRYLSGTSSLGIMYSPSTEMNLVGFTDSDYAGDKVERKSTSGFVFLVNGSAVTWSSQKQPVVAMSSTEAEYIALASGAREAVWLKRFLEELKYPQKGPCPINVDNQSAIKLSKNPEMHNRSKHIDVRYHYTRDLITDKQIEVDYIPTTEQLADCLTKPLLKAKHERNKEGLGMIRNEEKINLKGSSAPKKVSLAQKTYLWATIALCLCCIAGTAATGKYNAAPVLWRKSPVSITNGYNKVHLMVKFISPCEILNGGNVHANLTDEAKSKCEEIYQDMFLKELEIMCPRKQYTQVMHRKKRFIFTAIALIVGVVVVSAGLGVAGVAMSATNSGKISEMQTSSELHQAKLDELEEKILANSKNIDALRKDLNDVLQRLQDHQLDHDELKGKLISTNFAISYITGRLLIGKTAIREAHRQWKQGKVFAPLLDYFNFTLPCGDDCPIEYAKAQLCALSEDKKRLFMDFTAPVIDRDLLLVEADPFEMMLRRDNETCSVKYTGPLNAILSVKHNCLYNLNIRPPAKQDLIISPSSKCNPKLTMSKESKYFNVAECNKKQELDELDFIQIKPFHGQYNIYCPESNFTLSGKEQACPPDVFMLPIHANFKINDHEFVGSKVDISHQETLDPMLTLQANWHLKPSINWTDLIKDNYIPEKTKADLPVSHSVPHPVYWSMILCLIIIIAILSACLILIARKSGRDNTIRVIAKPIEATASV